MLDIAYGGGQWIDNIFWLYQYPICGEGGPQTPERCTTDMEMNRVKKLVRGSFHIFVAMALRRFADDKLLNRKDQRLSIGLYKKFYTISMSFSNNVRTIWMSRLGGILKIENMEIRQVISFFLDNTIRKNVSRTFSFHFMFKKLFPRSHEFIKWPSFVLWTCVHQSLPAPKRALVYSEPSKRDHHFPCRSSSHFVCREQVKLSFPLETVLVLRNCETDKNDHIDNRQWMMIKPHYNGR